MKRLIGALIVALFCVLLGAQSHVNAASKCVDQGLLAGPKVASFSFPQATPCSFKIILVGKGRVWNLASSGRIPLTISPIRDCAVKSLGIKPMSNGYIKTARIKATGKACEFWLRLRPKEDLPGFVWHFFLWDIARETHR